MTARWHRARGVLGIRRNARTNWYAARKMTLPSDKCAIQYLHTFLTGYTPTTDHIDGNGLNCLQSNMRPATRAQNNYNLPPNPGGTSKYKGVSWGRG
jgi:hypothetical protein